MKEIYLMNSKLGFIQKIQYLRGIQVRKPWGSKSPRESVANCLGFYFMSQKPMVDVSAVI